MTYDGAMSRFYDFTNYVANVGYMLDVVGCDDDTRSNIISFTTASLSLPKPSSKLVFSTPFSEG
jgi:hypothetical protein